MEEQGPAAKQDTKRRARLAPFPPKCKSPGSRDPKATAGSGFQVRRLAGAIDARRAAIQTISGRARASSAIGSPNGAALDDPWMSRRGAAAKNALPTEASLACGRCSPDSAYAC